MLLKLFTHSTIGKKTDKKSVKPESYISSKKIKFNNKYNNIKQNQKFEVKFYEFFNILNPVNTLVLKPKLIK